MTVFSKIVRIGLASVFGCLLLILSSFDCWAQAANPMPPNECCRKNPCKRSPGQPAHSTCQIQPASPERLAPPERLEISSVVSVAVADEQGSDVPRDFAAAFTVSYVSDYSPPDLFLRNSSFLI